MHITRLRIENFKSIGPAIELTDLGPVNVLHGPNNAGKSNILEAISVGLRVLNRLPEAFDAVDSLGFSEPEWVEMFTPDYPDADVTNRDAHDPGDPDCVHLVELDLEVAAPEVVLSIQALEADRIVHFREVKIGDARYGHGSGDDTEGDPDALAEVLAAHEKYHLDKPLFHTIRVADPRQDLAERLFAAKESQRPRDRDRWRALVNALAAYTPELQGARLTTITRRGEAGLAFEGLHPPHHIAPLEEQGQGIQATVHLLGEIFLADTDIIALEEPESHLSFTGQLRLRELLERVARDYNKQIFLTSHSFAFDCGEAFWRVSRDVRGFTQVERVHRVPEIAQPEWSEKLEQTMRTLRDQQSPPLPAAWLSREGLVLLPDRVRERLHLDHLDILYFVTNKETGRVELWTSDDFIDAEQAT